MLLLTLEILDTSVTHLLLGLDGISVHTTTTLRLTCRHIVDASPSATSHTADRSACTVPLPLCSSQASSSSSSPSTEPQPEPSPAVLPSLQFCLFLGTPNPLLFPKLTQKPNRPTLLFHSLFPVIRHRDGTWRITKADRMHEQDDAKWPCRPYRGIFGSA